MRGKQAGELLANIDLAFGLTKDDFKNGRPILTKWPKMNGESHDIEDLGDYSLKISKNLGDIYIDKIKTENWVIVGRGTDPHCDDLQAGKEVVENFEGFLM